MPPLTPIERRVLREAASIAAAHLGGGGDSGGEVEEVLLAPLLSLGWLVTSVDAGAPAAARALLDGIDRLASVYNGLHIGLATQR